MSEAVMVTFTVRALRPATRAIMLSRVTLRLLSGLRTMPVDRLTMGVGVEELVISTDCGRWTTVMAWMMLCMTLFNWAVLPGLTRWNWPPVVLDMDCMEAYCRELLSPRKML